MRINVREWLTRRGSSDSEATRSPGRETGAAQGTREGRATTIVALQADIRQLQHDITDLNTNWENGTDPSEREAATARLRTIEHALNLKQAELSKLQGRI